MHPILLSIHIFCFAVASGGGIANMIAMRRARAASPDAAKALAGLATTIGRVGFGALILLWITGVWMVKLRGDAALPTLFYVKMLAVVVLTGAALYIQYLGLRAARTKTPPPAQMMARLGMLTGISALTAMVLAIYAFS